MTLLHATRLLDDVLFRALLSPELRELRLPAVESGEVPKLSPSVLCATGTCTELRVLECPGSTLDDGRLGLLLSSASGRLEEVDLSTYVLPLLPCQAWRNSVLVCLYTTAR